MTLNRRRNCAVLQSRSSTSSTVRCRSGYTHLTAGPDWVGWSGLGPIAMLIENVIGLNVNVPERRIEWEIRLTEEHGVENLALGDLGNASLVCNASDGLPPTSHRRW